MVAQARSIIDFSVDARSRHPCTRSSLPSVGTLVVELLRSCVENQERESSGMHRCRFSGILPTSKRSIICDPNNARRVDGPLTVRIATFLTRRLTPGPRTMSAVQLRFRLQNDCSNGQTKYLGVTTASGAHSCLNGNPICHNSDSGNITSHHSALVRKFYTRMTLSEYRGSG